MNPDAMFKISYGLYVLSANEDAKDNACIVNTVMQVTDTPNRVSIAVNKQNLTHDMIKRTGRFAISMLDESVPFAIFERFGFKTGNKVDKFTDFHAVRRSGNGCIYLVNHVNAYLAATVISQTDLGTHTLFVAEVTDCDVLSDIPSCTYDYYHAQVKPKPEPVKKAGFRCKICGYVYEGDTLPEDYICPLCKHPASDFERIEIETK